MSNNRPLIIVACVLLAVIGGSLWFLNSKQLAPGPEVHPLDTKPAVVPTATVPATPDRGDRPPAVKADPIAKATPKPVPARELQQWEVQIDQVLRSTADESQTAQILINMLPTMPPDGQAEAASHITNLLLDEQYDKVLPLVKNPALSEEVLDVFVTDLMNREDKVKLSTLLEIAKIPNHPHQEEATTDLEIFLDEDFGKDWTKWDQAVKKYLSQQAAEEAADAAPLK